ncbi:MAG: 4Fe-4S binding protein [Methanobrevibacter sp.]|jgi:energy-converting hydrogenase A subunit Q|nr:4Fe-4S binding protein [Candidatus Methanoflexus mossambicus]
MESNEKNTNNLSQTTGVCIKPIRDVDVEYEINNEHCDVCPKYCIDSCPVKAVSLDLNGNIHINARCIGCSLCREACPYDSIKMDVKLSDPIRENVPNINSKLCRACGACVMACKRGAIHLSSSGGDNVHSVIDEDKCIRCGFCFRACPTDAIKYGEILPKTVSGGKAILINQKKCIGCMTCTRVCPSKGAIEIGNVGKLPFINPSYCARCEECMNICPTTAIRYSSRKKAYKDYGKLKSIEIASGLIENYTNTLSRDISRIDSILSKIARNISKENTEEEFEINVSGEIKSNLDSILSTNVSTFEMSNVIDYFPPIRHIKVFEEKCISCGECLNICPTEAIGLVGPSPISINENCVYCGQCVSVCPTEAIKLKEEFFKSEGNEIYLQRRDINGLRNGKCQINNEICQSCGVCKNSCPVDALTMENDELSVDNEKCISCRECESICPVNAIKICINTI